MKKVRVEEAVGQALCHDITAMVPGFKGALFKRGHVVAEEDIDTLLDIGKKHIYVGDMEPGMMHEEDCARRLAGMTGIDGAHFEGPSEGKMMLISDMQGMFRVDTDLLQKISEMYSAR